MSQCTVLAKNAGRAGAREAPVVSSGEPAAQMLTAGQEAEVLGFLARRPLHTVMMSGLVRDNGLESSLNRGSFYGCRDEKRRLTGVALIGEVTTFEARTEEALAAFARAARGNATKISLIIGEQKRVERFWRVYGITTQSAPQVGRELLFEQRWPVSVSEPVPGLRTATLDDLEMVVTIHAGMAFAESGINPLDADPEGFRRRCARRVGQNRVWILTDGEKLIFKADVVSETPAMAYLEGIYVNPGQRGKGYGFRCLSQLSRTLLARTRSVCLLVDERNHAAQHLYRKSGYQLRGCYGTIFLP